MDQASDAKASISGIKVVERISRQGLHLQTASLIAQIVAAAEPGSLLPTERELCAQLGIGRSTVREAMRSLAFIGAVRVRQGSGTYVSNVGEENVERLISLGLMLQGAKVHEAIEARQVLEAQVCRMAAQNHDESDAQELALIMKKMAETDSNPVKASPYDLQFHVRLAKASHNGVLFLFVNGMRALFEIWMSKAMNRPPVVQEIIGEHNSILDAVLARNGDLAAARMTVHLANAAERLFSVVGRNQSTADFISLLINPVEEQNYDRPSSLAEAGD